jgi:hypothetical protein
VRRASRRQPADRPLPTAFVEWRSRLFGEALEKEPTPGDLARAALGPAEDATAALESVAALIADGQIGPWPPSTGWVGDRMQKGREAVEGLEGDARASAIDDWLEKLCRALYEQSDPALLAQHLDEFAWVRWQTDQMEAARALLAASDAQASGEGAALALARARVDGLFGPFLAELRVVESSPLDESEDESPVRAGGS